jgi:Uma2 family endonuclease
MSTTTTTLLTFEEFERLPDRPGKRELLDGEVIEMPPPKTRHGKIQLWVQRRLTPCVHRMCLGEVYPNMGFKLGTRNWVQPDVSLVTSEQDATSDPDGYLEGAPRLAVEVISPANTPARVRRKIAKYFEFGGEEVWVFYPKSRHVSVHRAGEPAIEFHDLLTSRMFPGWELNLAEVFA